MNRIITMFTAVFMMLGSTQMIQAKEVSQAKPAGKLMFLGVNVDQTKDQITAQLKKKGYVAKKDNSGTPMLSGAFEGKSARVYVEDKVINVYDAKKYNQSQGKIRFNALLTKMKSTFGNGTYTDNTDEQKRFEMKRPDGEIVIWLYNDDEVNANSANYVINVYVTTNVTPVATAEPEEEEEDDTPLDNRIVVFVEHFFNNSKVDNITVKNLRQEIMTGMTGSRRIRVLDAFNYTDKELPSLDNKNERIQVIVSDGEISLKNSKGKTVTYKGKHAKFYLLGTLNSIDAKKVTDKNGNVSYQANVNYTLTLNNNQNITVGANTFNETYEGDTGDEAILRAIGRAGNRMRRFVDAYFPVEGKIVDIDEKDEKKENKKAVKSCYVSIGKADGIVVGDILEVFMEKDIAKRLVRKKIAEIKADEVMSDEITHCTVKNGGMEIYNCFFDEEYMKNYHLWVVSRPKKTINLSDDVEQTSKSLFKKIF